MASLARSIDNSPEESGSQPAPLAGRRIGFVSTVVGFGGSEVLIADAVEAALAGGAEVVCFCRAAAALRAILSSRNLRTSRLRFCDWPRLSATSGGPQPGGAGPRRSSMVKGVYRRVMPLSVKRYLGFLADARRFYRELVHHRLDALLINVNGYEASALGAGRWSQPRTIACYHLLWTEPTGSWLDRTADRLMRQRCVDAAGWVLHVSTAARDQWCRAVRLPASRTCVICSGVEDIPLASRQSVRRDLRLSPETFAFCVPGRFNPIKGHRFLLDAVARFKSQLDNCAVLLCGDGELEDELRQRSGELHIEHLVQFLGFRQDLPHILAAADCTVLPSLSENLSLAVLESLTAGTPAIVTDVGAMSEVVNDGVNGLVVPPADSGALGRAMASMASDRNWARKMRQAARQGALARYSKRRMMDEYVSLFSQVISSANA